jgi:hypothetical protein
MTPKGRAYLLDRLREPSTWRGMVALLTAFGLVLSPEQAAAIVAAGLAAAGAIGAFTPDKES